MVDVFMDRFIYSELLQSEEAKVVAPHLQQ